MRVLIYLDAERQRSYVDIVRAALRNETDAVVLAAGPGVSSSYFGLEGVSGTSQSFEKVSKSEPVLASISRSAKDIYRAIRSWIRDTSWPVLARYSVASEKYPRLKRILQLTAVIRLDRSVSTRIWRSLKRAFALLAAPWAVGGALPSFLYFVLERKRHVTDAQRMIKVSNADIVIVLEDNVEGLTGAVTHAARALKVPFVILPDYIPNPLEPARFYQASRAHQATAAPARLIARLKPNWRLSLNGQPLLRLPPAKIAAYHLLRSVPPKPWILNSGFAEVIALDSAAMRDHYLNLGFAASKLEVIGAAQDDTMFDVLAHRSQLRQQLRSELEFGGERPIIVCAFPPDQYPKNTTANFEYPDFAALAEAWFGAFHQLSSQCDVVVRPHPRLAEGSLTRFETQTVRISYEQTARLLPLSDLYVASISTTLKWALSLGIPCLNYDTYRYGYQDFAKAKGAITIDRMVELNSLLSTMSKPNGWYPALKASAIGDAHNWGSIDGCFNRRLSDLVRRVSLAPPKFSPTHSVRRATQ